MRLGVLLDRLGPTLGGAEAHTDALMRRALEKGDTVAVACLEGEPPPGVDRVALGRVPRSRPARDRHLADAGERALRDAGCDTVIAFRHALRCDVYLPHGGLVRDAWAARDAATGGATFLGRLAERWSNKRRFFVEAEQALLGSPSGPRVIALSRALAARIAFVYPATRMRTVVVPNGVDVAHFDPAPFAPRRDALRRELGVPVDAYVGLLLAHDPFLKGLSTVLLAMARSEVTELAPPFHLVVAGKRSDADVVAHARHAGVEGRVHVRGTVADPRPLYAAADVLVQPTWYDPCSLTCLEALAMGVPVITSARNGVAELMGMRGGIPVEGPESVEGVAKAIRILADAPLRAVTADDARYLAETNRVETRLDRVLAVCRGDSVGSRAMGGSQAIAGMSSPAEAADEGPPADPSLLPDARR